MTTCNRCDVLQQELAAAHTRIARLEEEVTSARQQLAEVSKLCELQQADLDRYQKAYEASRPNHPERAPSDQLQLAFARVMENLGEQDAANDTGHDDGGAAAQDPETGADANPPRKPKKRDPHGRRKLGLSGLAVLEQVIVPDEVKAAGGVGFELIGEEVSDRLARRPAEWIVLRIKRQKYVKVGGDESDETAEADATESPIVTASLPLGVWPGVMGDPSAIAHVIVSKYDDLLPLNRQESISARDGFRVPKATQCSWLRGANGFCTLVVDAMFDDAKRHAYMIATDATGASVLPPRWRPGKPRPDPPEEPRRCESWHIFVFLADRDHVVFRYDREHSGAVFTKFLAGYHGNIQADAASVFDVLYRDHGMTEHGCWSHCRRPFYRALESDRPRALEALAMIGKLFEVDRKLRLEDHDPETFTELRRKGAEPILDLFDKWVDANREQVDPRSPLDSAIGYYDNQRDALHRFLYDGRIRLDNNLSEQALRKLRVGEANWVFFANETGIAWYTTFRSLIASCLLHRLNPQLYLEQLLRLVPHWPKSRVLELAPKYWLDTVAKLEPSWRSILARPWEPEVVLSAEMSGWREPSAAPRTTSRAA
jgi:transposase